MFGLEVKKIIKDHERRPLFPSMQRLQCREKSDAANYALVCSMQRLQCREFINCKVL